MNDAIANLAEVVGRKPKSADYFDKETWKEDVRAWERRQRVAESLFRFAADRGCEVTVKHRAAALKTGGATLTETRRIAFKVTGRKASF